MAYGPSKGCKYQESKFFVSYDKAWASSICVWKAAIFQLNSAVPQFDIHGRSDQNKKNWEEPHGIFTSYQDLLVQRLMGRA